MNAATSLGPLANAVIEQFGDLARNAVASSVGHREKAHRGKNQNVHAPRVIGHLFSVDELALQYLQPGNWVAVGCVFDGADQLLIEINMTTEESRERPAHCLHAEKSADLQSPIEVAARVAVGLNDHELSDELA